MRIYTKKGDQGHTSLLRGGRVPKDHARVSAYGDVDELNATIGVAAAVEPLDFEPELFEDIQKDLFSIGSMLATADYDGTGKKAEKIDLPETRITALEAAIDAATESMPPLEAFVLPGGSQKAAMLHHARTVCRRAERSLITLGRNEAVPTLVLPYLNRLSDLLFTFARLANMRAGISDREW
jgi:cob(I)alamin adenosyltransferase